MSTAACPCCSKLLERYMEDPLRCINSAAGDDHKALDDLKAIVLNGTHTPVRHADACLKMFVKHLSAGDQTKFDPLTTPPAHLLRYEQRAFQSMAGIFTLFNGYSLREGHYSSAPVQTLLDEWPNIRKWIHFFFHRTLIRKTSATPELRDEDHFDRLGEFWEVYTIVSTIFTVILLESQSYFATVLANDGSFPLIMKLYARRTRRPPEHSLQLPRDTMLFRAVLMVAISNGNTHGVQADLVREVGGPTGPANLNCMISFVSMPIRFAANNPPSLAMLEAEDQICTPTILLFNELLGGTLGGVDPQPPVFGPAFFQYPLTDPHPQFLSILIKYTGLCKTIGRCAPQSLQTIIIASMAVCSTLLWYEGSVEYAVQLLDGGLLDAYANIVHAIDGFSESDVAKAAFLLEQNIATFLSHEIVISSAKSALHRLERERKNDYDALTEGDSRLSDAWRYFRGHAFERATMKGIYDAKFRKEDKLSCDSCHTRMNDKKLFKCGGCKSELYCSKECQAKAWKEHKTFCKIRAKNLEVFKIKADASHFVKYLTRTDIRRHLPGLNILAQENPRIRDLDTPLAYRADYRSAPPVFDIFPVSDLEDGSKHAEEGIIAHAHVKEMSRELYKMVRESKGLLRIVEVHMRGYARTPSINITAIDAFDFLQCSDTMPASFNPERPRGVDEERRSLAIQHDSVDMVMADAIYGRTLSPDDFGRYLNGCSHLVREQKEKTVFQRVDDAVKRRKDRNEEPCCRDLSGRSI